MKNSYLLIACLLLLTHQQTRAERIDTLLHFSYADLKVDTLTALDGNTYTKLTYPGCGEGDRRGAPVLPVRYLMFKIPANAVIVNYDSQTRNSHSRDLLSPLLPVQFPASFDEHSSPFVPCDNGIYTSDEKYPSSNAIFKGKACIMDTLYVYFAVYPVRYLPLEKKFEFQESIQVSLSYKMKTTEKDYTENKSTNSINLPVYDYCVITTRQLKDAFRRLIGWKRMKGYNAGIVCVEDIMECSQITGDMLTPTPQYLLTDSAAKIRQYLRYAKGILQSNQNNNNNNAPLMAYVLMGGDYSVVPIRYGTGNNNMEYDESDHIPSDLYFGELEANWKTDDDEYLGEPDEAKNYGANLYVGRILCTTTEEVENYTDKLLRYEMDPGAGDYSYLRKALYVQADEAQHDSVADSLARHNIDIFPDSTIIQEKPSYNQYYPTYPNGNNVISKIRNHYGLVSFNAHGTPYEIFVSTSALNEYHSYLDSPFYAVTSVNGARTISRPENANGLDNLNNKHYPMIGFSVSCDNAPFDILTDEVYDTVRTFNAYPCLAKSFTLRKNSGGPAWIGCTRWGLQETSPLLQEHFFNSMRDNPIGVALTKARALCVGDCQHYVSLSTNVIGCPELRVWTGIPSHIEVTKENNGNWSFFPAQNETIYVGSRSFVADPEETNITETHYSVIGESIPPDDNALMLYGKNRLPTILPFSIKDGYLTQSAYIFAKDATLGNGTGTQCVEFDTGADYIFETGGTFTLGKNVKINRGAKLLIKPSDINF